MSNKEAAQSADDESLEEMYLAEGMSKTHRFVGALSMFALTMIAPLIIMFVMYLGIDAIGELESRSDGMNLGMFVFISSVLYIVMSAVSLLSVPEALAGVMSNGFFRGSIAALLALWVNAKLNLLMIAYLVS